jgi:hypothetical protein
LSFVPVEDELLSKDDPIPSSLSGDLLLPAFPFLLSIILLKQFSAVNISVRKTRVKQFVGDRNRLHQEEEGIKV